MQTYTVAFGGWYQRTTLHLSEIYDFVSSGISRLPLSDKKLAKYHTALDIEKATREVGSLEYVSAITSHGIEIRYYEDGLYILNYETDDIVNAKRFLTNYFENLFEPAISYIFSLGAPTPKVLANIKSHHPMVVTLIKKNPEDYKVEEKYGKVYSKIDVDGVSVYKTHSYIFIVADASTEHLRNLSETQVFFREFKDQLEKYLNIHRTIWEEIAHIKERGVIKGGDVEKLRSKLDSYQKTIGLIKNRINQMGAYIGTRRSIAKNAKVEGELISLFQYKFETLSDTHSYIKELWSMTENYLDSAIKLMVEIVNQSTNVSIRSLQLITTVGVLSGILAYLARDEFPKLSPVGVAYFMILVVATWAINKLVWVYYQKKKYKVQFTDRAKEI